ncbi:MAG: LptA/OstA family protein [Alphaproteobacteria bacterium]
MKIFKLGFIFILCLVCFDVMAQNPDSKKPLEITADESLEWHRNALYFKAKKNVKAVQGGTTLISDVLTAKYRDGDKSSMEIYHIQADGHVSILSAQSKAYGDKAVYQVDKGYAVMTGRNLRLISDGQSVTARDKFEYWVNGGKLIASGNAVVVREGDKIVADKMIAMFSEDANGKRVLKSLEAIGHVVITTPEEELKGDRATYDAAGTTAILHDNVVIKRGPNILEGTRAELNTATNVSKIFGGITQSGEAGGRVRGIFYPQSAEKKESE